MSKHTPGPWKVEEGTTLVWTHDPDIPGTYGMGFPVAMLLGRRRWNRDNRPTPDEQEASARLIAAAPEMFELLKTVENDAGQVPEWLWQRIREVITRVEGAER